MAGRAHDLFGDQRPERPVRHEVPIATPEDLKRARLVQVLFTCAAPRSPPPATFRATPRQAVERILATLGRTPHQVSVTALPATPHDVEFRDEVTPDAPRHLMALAFTGLNIAEARAVLASLQTSIPKPKGRWQ